MGEDRPCHVKARCSLVVDDAERMDTPAMRMALVARPLCSYAWGHGYFHWLPLREWQETAGSGQSDWGLAVLGCMPVSSPRDIDWIPMETIPNLIMNSSFSPRSENPIESGFRPVTDHFRRDAALGLVGTGGP
jgi:hypothetical protein